MAKKPTGLDDVLHVIGELAGTINDRFDKLEVQTFKQGEDIKELKQGLEVANKKIDHLYEVLDSHMKRIEDIVQDNKSSRLSAGANGALDFSACGCGWREA